MDILFYLPLVGIWLWIAYSHGRRSVWKKCQPPVQDCFDKAMKEYADSENPLIKLRAFHNAEAFHESGRIINRAYFGTDFSERKDKP